MSIINNPSLAGQIVGKAFLCGENYRYKIAPIHTRFESVEWFVWDALTEDEETGLPSVVGQYQTEAEARARAEA